MIVPIFDLCPGLEYLAHLDGLFVKQMVEMLEVMTGFETENRFIVLNRNGQTVFTVIKLLLTNAKLGLKPLFNCSIQG